MVARANSTHTSVEEYLAAEATSPIKHEYVDGQVYAMSGGTLDHSRIGRNAVTLLEAHLDGTPCEALNSDIHAQVSPTVYRYPDAVVTCDERDRQRGGATQIHHPKLIIEVLADSTEAADRGREFEEYCQIAEFEEYLLLDSERVAADHFRRGEHNRWVFNSHAPGDTVTLDSIGLACPLEAFYRRTSLAGSYQSCGREKDMTMEWQDRIVVDPNVLVGKPVIRGTRLAVEFIIDLLANGWSNNDILSNYPGTTREDILACLAYASTRLHEEKVYPR